MTGANTGSIAEFVVDLIYNIPDSVNSGTNIVNWVEMGKRYVQNWTGDTISSDSIPEKYQTVLTNLGCAYTLSKMIGTNIDFNVRIGEFNASKVPSDSPESTQMNFYLAQVNEELKSIGRKAGNRYSKVMS